MTDDALETVRSYFERSLAGDPGFAELFAEDATWWVPPGSRMAGTYRGMAEILPFVEKAFGLYDTASMKLDIERLISDGSWVCALFTLESRTVKGRDWSGQYAIIFEVRDRKIRQVREFVDTARINEIVFE